MIGALLVTLNEPVDVERAAQVAHAIGMIREVLEVSTVPEDCQQEMNRERVRHEFFDALVRVLMDKNFRVRNSKEVRETCSRPSSESGWKR